ncbi:SMODS domain-containing nucleotidyltransferase [Streptomyces qinglanensis]|uniref:SMODS domain-containing nucleotidyltransferase n=1 Tax=Streptomyces qinglanensis TaxID=943816 RepID=UPI0037A10C7D
MAHLKQQFKDALSSIEPGDDKTNAPEAHRLVRDALKADSKLAEYGVSPILIGSYKRNVSIRRIKDVDVFVRLPDVPSDVTSTEFRATSRRRTSSTGSSRSCMQSSAPTPTGTGAPSVRTGACRSPSRSTTSTSTRCPPAPTATEPGRSPRRATRTSGCAPTPTG